MKAPRRLRVAAGELRHPRLAVQAAHCRYPRIYWPFSTKGQRTLRYARGWSYCIPSRVGLYPCLLPIGADDDVIAIGVVRDGAPLHLVVLVGPVDPSARLVIAVALERGLVRQVAAGVCLSS